MALDTRYVPLFSLQDVLFDKTLGEPLSGGFVSFFSDNNRNVVKNVYEISGVPPNYIYTNITSHLTLSSIGTFVDSSGNDIVPYLFPYDGDATSTTGRLDLYYITVTDSHGNPQFTREGVPNLADSGNSSTTNVQNFAGNGQLLLHNTNSPVGPPGTYNTNSSISYGGTLATMDVTPIAPGGYVLERTNGSSATDTVTFTRLANQYVGTISGSPRYAININRSIAASDIFQLGIRFMDVNKFAAKNITFLFNAKLNSGTSLPNVKVYEVDYYGTSASTSNSPVPANTVYTEVGGPFTVTNNQFQFAANFDGKVNFFSNIGTDNNDFVEFAIVFPTGVPFNIQITDFMVLQGIHVGGVGTGQTTFPIVTNGQFIVDALDALAQTTSQPTNATPDYYPEDGSNYYLPVLMTPSGFTYDYSRVGTIDSSIYSNTYATASTSKFPVFLCDGASKVSSTYTSLGVPQSRLGQVLIQDSPIANTPKYGTGADYATAYAFTAPTNAIRVSVNTAGTATVATQGATSTGFTITGVNLGAASINYKAYSNIANTVLAVGNFPTPFAILDNGTSGFTLTALNNQSGLLAQQFYAFTALCIAAAGIANPGGAGKYFKFSNAGTTYYMWFHFTNETDPAPGGTGIQINLDGLGTATAQDVANIVREAINKYEVSSIIMGALPSASSYFNFSNQGNSKVYNVWYQVAGVGTAPTAPTGANIQVTLTGAETTAQCATKTLTAINAYQYAVPDFRGMFLRGLDPSGTWDSNVTQRWSTLSALSGANLGTFEFQQFLSHTHSINGGNFLSNNAGPPAAYQGGPSGTVEGLSIGNTGGTETRPVNTAVNFFIRY